MIDKDDAHLKMLGIPDLSCPDCGEVSSILKVELSLETSGMHCPHCSSPNIRAVEKPDLTVIDGNRS